MTKGRGEKDTKGCQMRRESRANCKARGSNVGGKGEERGETG